MGEFLYRAKPSLCLYRGRDKIFPSNLEICGKSCGINADFRNILRIFAMLKDDNISEYKKFIKLTQWFFIDIKLDALDKFGDSDDISNDMFGIMIQKFIYFVNSANLEFSENPENSANSANSANYINSENPENSANSANFENSENSEEIGYDANGGIRRFDYDFDGEEIYSSFISEYNIDLVEIDFLHWRKFRILLGGLSGESAFKKKLELRYMDLSAYCGKDFIKMSAAKEAVQIPAEYTAGELRALEEFADVWEKC